VQREKRREREPTSLPREVPSQTSTTQVNQLPTAVNFREEYVPKSQPHSHFSVLVLTLPQLIHKFYANYTMASHSNAQQEEPTTVPPTSDSEVEWESDAESYSGEEMTEEEIEKWLSTKYERGLYAPMKKPLSEPWGLAISDADVEKMKVSFKTPSMDIKFDLLMEDPDENGGLSLHIIRSFGSSHQECFVLHIVLKEGGSSEIKSITWEGNKGGLQCDAEQAKKEAVILSRCYLHCEFETLPHYPLSMLYQASGYKKVDVE